MRKYNNNLKDSFLQASRSVAELGIVIRKMHDDEIIKFEPKRKRKKRTKQFINHYS